MIKDGKLKVTLSGKIPLDEATGLEITGVTGNWWVGLSLLHNLFTMEHNRICEMLKAKYPNMTDQKLFDKSRLINSAVITKITFLEVANALSTNPTTRASLKWQYYGVLDELGLFGKFLRGVLGGQEAFRQNSLLHGILGSSRELFNVPYSTTEEWVSVYRMH